MPTNLTEWVLAMGLLILCGGMLVPLAVPSGRLQAKTALQQCEILFNYAQVTAFKRNLPVTITLHNHTLWVRCTTELLLKLKLPHRLQVRQRQFGQRQPLQIQPDGLTINAGHLALSGSWGRCRLTYNQALRCRIACY